MKKFLTLSLATAVLLGMSVEASAVTVHLIENDQEIEVASEAPSTALVVAGSELVQVNAEDEVEIPQDLVAVEAPATDLVVVDSQMTSVKSADPAEALSEWEIPADQDLFPGGRGESVSMADLDGIGDDDNHKANRKAQDDAAEAQKNSWSNWALGIAGDNLSYYGKLYGAYCLSYAGADLIENGAAHVAYAGGYLFGGSIAGNAAYYTAKGTIKVARYFVPGAEALMAATVTPMVKSCLVDPAVSAIQAHGPSVAKQAKEWGSWAAGWGASKAKGLASWAMGSAAAA